MKKLIELTFVIAFIFLASYNVYHSHITNPISNLALANVEALADGGEGSSDKGLLYGTAPDSEGHCYYCCCPGDNNCSAAACSKC